MTKNLGNAAHGVAAKTEKPSLFGKAASALFPLVVVALGYLIGKQFFGF